MWTNFEENLLEGPTCCLMAELTAEVNSTGFSKLVC
jgi:hypothetical protein